MIETLIGTSPWFWAKIGASILLGMYLIFALIVVRQVKLMTDTLQLGYEGFITLLSYAHLIFAVLVFLTALIVL